MQPGPTFGKGRRWRGEKGVRGPPVTPPSTNVGELFGRVQPNRWGAPGSNVPPRGQSPRRTTGRWGNNGEPPSGALRGITVKQSQGTSHSGSSVKSTHSSAQVVVVGTRCSPTTSAHCKNHHQGPPSNQVPIHRQTDWQEGPNRPNETWPVREVHQKCRSAE